MQDARPNEHDFSAIFEAAPSAMLVVGEDNIISLVNRAAERLFGYDATELVGANVEILMPEHFRAQHANPVSAFARTPELRSLGPDRALFGQRKDGSEVPVQVGVAPVEFAHNRFIIVSVVEIVDQRRIQTELNARATALEKFAYVVSHDLKAPLRGINLAVRWLRDELGDALSDNSKENLGFIESRVTRITGLISGVVRYSKAQRGPRQVQAVDLKALADEVIAQVAASTTCLITAEGPWPTVSGDRKQIAEVLYNLLDNATKFHEGPYAKVQLGVTSTPRTHRITVTDNGPGISPEHREWVFEPFTTLRPRDECETAGVGLSLCKSIVERWGGQIGIESAAPRGSTVWFTIPASPA